MGRTRTGRARGKDGRAGRFRRFTREDIEKRGDNLDVTWLKDESAGGNEELPEPEVIAGMILERLQTAMEEIEALQEELGAGT
ncbi:MAG: hypothetical protein R3F14_12590 [Polyangiaceae bacterium]